MKIEIETYTLPEYWASALVNNDYSGMDAEEVLEIQEFLEGVAPSYPVSCSEEPFFQWSNDANSLGANCLEYTFLITSKV